MGGAALGIAFGALQLWLLIKGARSVGTEKLNIWALVLQFLCPLAGLLLCAWLLRSQLVACAVAMAAVLLAGSASWAIRRRREDRKQGEGPEKKV
jgi:positive regulator of sigma E activity